SSPEAMSLVAWGQSLSIDPQTAPAFSLTREGEQSPSTLSAFVYTALASWRRSAALWARLRRLASGGLGAGGRLVDARWHLSCRLRRKRLSWERLGFSSPDVVQRNLKVGPEARRQQHVEDQRDPSVHRLEASD